MSRPIGLTAVCVACLLLVAGCAAPTNSSESSTTLTASDVENTSALIQTHTETLQARPFTARSTTTVRDANGTFRVTVNRTYRVDPRRPVRALSVRAPTATENAPERYRQTPARVTAWRYGNETTIRVEADNDTRVRRVDLLNSSVRLNRALHRQLLYRYSTRQNATVESVSRDGVQLYRVRTDLEDTHVTSNASMTLLVNRTGYVQRIETRQTVAYRSGPRIVTKTVRFSRVGTTDVEAPPWAETSA